MHKWEDVFVVKQSAPPVQVAMNRVVYAVKNAAGTEFSFSVVGKTKDFSWAVRATKAKKFFIAIDRHYGVTDRKIHSSIILEHDVEQLPYGLVILPMVHPIRDEPVENFERMVLFPFLRRSSTFVYQGKMITTCNQLQPPPEQFTNSVTHFLSFGSLVADEHEATLVKLMI